ncbi:DNA replication licensing factor MCM2, putative [Plasmodium berghei]|uniref:DNA replication licensing factor MCM2 n=2 Tax=Plasmodium berghei TaxID=5821 RepID=A0A509AJY2_PLABA|nr:DNA replication licensing factor MCM2, putative [Plasmodium berghei ANKA]CXI53924.1 DNA replication licensing factor MCM2, putative [Plasmodium berghei]SCL94875.1 DNA replication licensing factor MCM2, putative [Plasmodium berghei]SCM16124.1 DNA replication licensing factor MCM2, putative [Plasmodium berghei]SCM17920.1 DNA replication licensing factor MCM2, putative [Plasmodium berghei]SCN26270.1 DNA replication licensing factor MCM2, putative [Plasmodium berghei]|eukprot:XP_034422048.1 DNA replication licensing factor MCM2, putative [Plasmodium berghei ANKA]
MDDKKKVDDELESSKYDIDEEDLLDDEGRLNEEERQAELEGSDLFEEDDGFVFGEEDEKKEIQKLRNLGLDNDEYDEDFIDDEVDYEDNLKARRAAERNIQLQRKQEGRYQKNKFWKALENHLGDDEEEDIFDKVAEKVAKRRENLHLSSDETDIPDLSNLESAKICLSVNPKDVIFDERYQQAADTCFRYFLHRFSLKDSMGVNIEQSPHLEYNETENMNDFNQYYIGKIEKMILNDKHTLIVSAKHLIQFHCENLVQWIEFKPEQILEVLHECLMVEAYRISPKLYKGRICKVVLKDWPYSTQLRNLRCTELNTLIKVTGVCVKRGYVLPKLRVMYLKCNSCDTTLSEVPIYFSDGKKPVLPRRCPHCQSSTFSVDRIKTAYTDYQKITLQESPNSVPAGRAPRQREVVVTGDLVDKVKPGEEVEVLGIYKTKYDIGLNIKYGFPILQTEIEANNIERKEDIQLSELTDDDIKDIIKLSKDPNIRERIITSIAPAIWGHKDIKTSIAYALFGGVQKGGDKNNAKSNESSHFGIQNKDILNNFKGGHTIRGDINVLLLGDPGLGKSQVLQYIHKTNLRTIYTTGKGASAVGLTAGVRKDHTTNEWTLEGGALVLADEGICIIDEFDKMTDKDRVSIHEAMEQQSISISKAGIVTTLRARCAVIAAANPIYGRYDPTLTFKENVDLSDPILSRFDLITVLRDIPNVDEDFYLAEYVVTNHQLSHPKIENTQNYQKRIENLKNVIVSSSAYEPIPQDLLQKYIIYARTNCKPSLSDVPYAEISAKLSNFYSRVRQKASASGGYPLTLRHIESVIRIAEANAKMRLSQQIVSKDVDYAIATLLESYVSCQRFAVAKQLSKEFARYRALFRGGHEVLCELVRRAMQQTIQRENLKNVSARDFQNDTESGTENETEFLNPNNVFLPLNIFMKTAMQNKFSEYQIVNWMKSKVFNEHYSVIKRDNVEGIISKKFKV